MSDTSDSSHRELVVDPKSPEEAGVPDRDLDGINATFQEVREGDSISLTIGYDDTIQDVEMIVNEILHDGSDLNPDWEIEIRCVSKVVPPESADDIDHEYLQVFVIGTPPKDHPPWFVYSYRVRRSTGDKLTFVDPETDEEYPTCFAHGWVVDAKNYYGGDIR